VGKQVLNVDPSPIPKMWVGRSFFKNLNCWICAIDINVMEWPCPLCLVHCQAHRNVLSLGAYPTQWVGIDYYSIVVLYIANCTECAGILDYNMVESYREVCLLSGWVFFSCSQCLHGSFMLDNCTWVNGFLHPKSRSILALYSRFLPPTPRCSYSTSWK
jgi:hypothetical protein